MSVIPVTHEATEINGDNGDTFVLVGTNAGLWLGDNTAPSSIFATGANQTINFGIDGRESVYDYGQGTAIEESSMQSAPIFVHNFSHDPTGVISLLWAVKSEVTVTSDHRGGTMISAPGMGKIDLLGDTHFNPATQLDVISWK